MDKRKTLESATAVCKKPKMEPTKDSYFLEDTLPDHVFALGDSVFVTVNTFQGDPMIHVRRYKKFGKKCYPTVEGVTLQPRWLELLMGRKEVPAQPEDLPGGLLIPPEQFKVESEDFEYFTWTRIKSSEDGRIFTRSIAITKVQWLQMLGHYKNISTQASNLLFKNWDFLAVYTGIYEMPNVVVDTISLDVSLGQQCLKDLLKKSLCDTLKDIGELQDPETRAEELLGNRVETFNASALCLDVQELARQFYENQWEDQHFLMMRPGMYLTTNFLKNVCLKKVLQNARQYFCPENVSEYFEDLL